MDFCFTIFINEYAADELELIPHSDTKHLDFLASCFGKSEMDTIEACLEDGLKFRVTAAEGQEELSVSNVD